MGKQGPRERAMKKAEQKEAEKKKGRGAEVTRRCL
jgi:hypothetical protein